MLNLIYYSFLLIIISLITLSASASLTAAAAVVVVAAAPEAQLEETSPPNGKNPTDNKHSFDRTFSRFLHEKKRASDTAIPTNSNHNSSIIKQTTRFSSNVNIYTIKSNLRPSTAAATSNKLDCKPSDDLRLNALQSATVLRGLAVEKFKYYSSANKLKSYSIMFKVEHVYKLDEKLLHDSTRTILFSKPLVEQTLNLTNTHSYILVENFKSDDIATSNNNALKNCYSIDLKLNRSYYLYLNNSAPLLGKQAHFSHPVRFRQNNEMKSTILMLRMPVFYLTGQPVEASKLSDSQLRLSVCANCLTKVKFEKRVKIAQLSKDVRLVCRLEGEHEQLNVLWKKNKNSNIYLRNSSKFTIETTQKFSILNIKSVNYTDQGYYYCAVRDRSSLETIRFITDKIKLVVLEENKILTTGSTLAYTRIAALQDLFAPNPTSTSKLVTLATSKLSRLWSNKSIASSSKSSSSTSSSRSSKTTTSFAATTRLDSTHIQKSTTRYNEIYVECDQDENICWNGGTCYKTSPSLAHTDIIHKKFCICKKYYEPPFCEIEMNPSHVDFDQEEDASEIPDDLKDLWNSLSFSRTVNLTNYKRTINSSISSQLINTSSSSSSLATLSEKQNNSKRISDYLSKKKKLFYRNNHI